jgi:predicted ATPase
VLEKHALRIGRDGSLSKVIVKSPSASHRGSGTSLKLPDGLNLQDSNEDLERHGEIQRALQRQNVTISQLNLSEIELYGREAEISVLVAAFEEASPVQSTPSLAGRSTKRGSRRHRPVVVNVIGSAGTGKTRLCQELGRLSVVQKRCGFVLKGKYESQIMIPYMGIVKALSELPGQISGKWPLLYPKFRESLRSAIGGEAALLASLVPTLANLLGIDTESEKTPTPTDEVYTTRINRLHYVVRQLFKVICTADHPLILILDDMQWCDSSSLSLLSSIVRDGRLSHLLVVTTCREDDTARPYLDLLASYQEEHHIIAKSIQLGNLDQSAVLSMVSTALRSSEEKTFQLSEIVHQKSNGNPLYVLQFLTRLYEDGLLKYNIGLMQWTWEETRVRTRFVMDNVADLTSAKLQGLPVHSQTILQIASCLGQTFDKDHLEFVIRGPRVRQIYS